MLTNNPPATAIAEDALRELIADAKASVEAMQGEASSDDEAAELAALLDRAKAMRTSLKTDKEAAVRPAKDAYDAARSPWLELEKTLGDNAKRTGVFGLINPALAPYQLELKAEQEAQEKAARIARAKAYHEGDVAAATQAQEALEGVAYVKHTRKVKVVTLTDRAQAIAHILSKDPEHFDGMIERFVKALERETGTKGIPGACIEDGRDL